MVNRRSYRARLNIQRVMSCENIGKNLQPGAFKPPNIESAKLCAIEIVF